MSLILRLDEHEMNFSDFRYSRRHGMEEDPLKSWAQQSLRRLATSAHDYKLLLALTRSDSCDGGQIESADVYECHKWSQNTYIN